MALRAAGFTGTRVGVGRRVSSLRKALACEAVDVVTRDVAAGVAGARLVVLCTPIRRFEALLGAMAEGLTPGTYVTDVASTKTEPVRLARRLLPASVRFVGSHPMAGSEKTGVEFARADLFQNALCLLTPEPKTPVATVRWFRRFWEALGCYTQVVSPSRHDELLACVSHLPHAVATALVGLAVRRSAIELAGPGFADTTRIASGDPAMWTDIFRTNHRAMIKAVDQLIRELGTLRRRLDRDDADGILRWLTSGKQARDEWVSRLDRKRKVSPP